MLLGRLLFGLLVPFLPSLACDVADSARTGQRGLRVASVWASWAGFDRSGVLWDGATSVELHSRQSWQAKAVIMLVSTVTVTAFPSLSHLGREDRLAEELREERLETGCPVRKRRPGRRRLLSRRAFSNCKGLKGLRAYENSEGSFKYPPRLDAGLPVPLVRLFRLLVER